MRCVDYWAGYTAVLQNAASRGTGGTSGHRIPTVCHATATKGNTRPHAYAAPYGAARAQHSQGRSQHRIQLPHAAPLHIYAKEKHLKQKQIAGIIGKSESYITRRIKFIEDKIERDMIDDGELTPKEIFAELEYHKYARTG